MLLAACCVLRAAAHVVHWPGLPLDLTPPASPPPPSHRADLNLLKHDKPLAAAGAAAAAAHLKHLPSYLRDPNLQGKTFASGSGERRAGAKGWIHREGLRGRSKQARLPAPTAAAAAACCTSAASLSASQLLLTHSHPLCVPQPNLRRTRRAADAQAAAHGGAGPGERLPAGAPQGGGGQVSARAARASPRAPIHPSTSWSFLPAHPPAHTPTLPPTRPPTHPPVHLPTHPPTCLPTHPPTHPFLPAARRRPTWRRRQPTGARSTGPRGRSARAPPRPAPSRTCARARGASGDAARRRPTPLRALLPIPPPPPPPPPPWIARCIVKQVTDVTCIDMERKSQQQASINQSINCSWGTRNAGVWTLAVSTAGHAWLSLRACRRGCR